MKSGKLLFAFIMITALLVSIESCQRIQGCTDVTATNYNPNATYDNGSCKYNGQATFYFDQNGPNATVTIGGQSASVTANYQTGAPGCGTGAVGCANFTLPAGSYRYTASSASTSWSDTLTISPNGCSLVDLPQSTGSVTFWTSSTAYGNITVVIGGGLGTGVVSAVLSSTPLCGASGCATFNLPPGIYSYTAAATNGTTWGPSNFTVMADGCQPLSF